MLTLIELVLRLQRPENTSRTSSKPPSTDRKERRERSKPGGAKPGHEGHSRVMSEAPDDVVARLPDRCSGCGTTLSAALPADVVSVDERIDLPEVVPVVTQHRRLAVRCPCCGLRVTVASRTACCGSYAPAHPWRTLPARKGPSGTVSIRSNRWRRAGVFDQALKRL